ncbi:MAG: radical SAM protein [Candidatus Aenigmarchaeota archaeon]|nr:radical SAM protein [Candidatus Aenigmarchaeota archaeon]MDI6722104.1 radical SAM protein [Candidatus Aenigmarchaeota archaeon]
MKVLFVIPSSVGDYFSAQVPHTGIAYVSAVLKQDGIETKIVDMRLGYTMEDVLKIIDDYQPQFVGITLYSFGFDRSKQTIDQIKLHNSSYTVVIGGPHVAAIRKKVLESTLADVAVVQEGEIPMLQICQGLPLSEIKGIIWRNGGEIVENPDMPYVKSLDELPFPDYEGFEIEKYLGYKERHLPLVTSRGCPYQCIFCSIRLSMGLKFRARSPENIVGEIEYWNKKGWGSFEIDDDNFTLDMARAHKICDLIIEKGLDIIWKCDNGIRADRVDLPLLQKMKKAGCVYISVGVEAGNDKILKVIKKGEKLETVINAINLAKEAGIAVGATFIIGHPEETYDDFLDSLKIAESLPVDHVSFYNLVPYPGTELYNWVEHHGSFVMDKETFLYNVAHWKNKPIFETSTFSVKERRKAYKRAHSLYRKRVLQFKLGKGLGYMAWFITGPEFMEKSMKKIVLTPGIGRTLFNAVKKHE